MSYENQYDWLSLIEISGPFLAVPVLKEVFPQGLDELSGSKRKRVRQAYEEWRDALELDDEQFPELHAAWVDEVLSRCLELDEDSAGDVLKRADWCSSNLQASLLEHGVTLSPDFVVVDEQHDNKPLLLIQSYMQDVDLDVTFKQGGWAATPRERMVQLCRSLGCRLGLVTNGERWMLVDAPVGAVTTFASWYARIWNQEPVTLQAFVHFLGIRRFFVDKAEQLPALLDRSLKFQDEVTDALGEQVRRAVEVLIQSLDKADQDRNRELLHEVTEPELYESALTVMMRLVFLLSAEERGLMLMGDERYEANYALSTLRMQLRKESDEILERRWDAWSRLLAIFRAVSGGIEHENLRLPALGGSLFNPDRFPFLEGRAKGSNWRNEAAKPLPIDNRTVLLLLEAIQQYQGRTLSYRALDVEQIGYVYEGLLERTVKRTEEVTLELDATKGAKMPWVSLAELDSARLDGAAQLAKLLKERSGSSANRVKNDLARTVDDALADRLLTACQGDSNLRDRIKPYANLLRTDPWGYPLVYPAGAFVVTSGSDRRESGTHYTPKSLTEAIVAETLTPVVYIGPAEGLPREQWILKSPTALLDLKICDPAMGSGAFLVQACRWLSERLVEAWSQAEATGKTLNVNGEVLETGVAKEPMPRDSEARTLIARRLIAERCLYGVDLNPLAVELAKLSIWLVTLAKGRPFGFLDHNLRCGDSLLGIHRLDQLTELSMTPRRRGEQTRYLFGQNIEQSVCDAIELRIRLREIPIRDIRDVEAMVQLDMDARRRLEIPECIADAFIGEALASGGCATVVNAAVAMLTIYADKAASGDRDAYDALVKRGRDSFSIDLLPGASFRKPFHWPLEYPEVFAGAKPGFNAIVSNPPWGASLCSKLQAMWKSVDGDKLDRMIDSFHLFLIRSCQLLNQQADSSAGLLVPDVLLYQGYSQKLRETLLSENRITHVCNIGDGAFARVTRPCCYVIFSAKKGKDSEISVGRWRTSSSEVGVEFKLPQATLRNFPGCIIPTNNLREYSEIARLVSAIPCKLANLVNDNGIQRGVSADNKDVFVMPDEHAKSEKLEAAFLKKVVTGGVHVKPFDISENLPLLIYTTRETPPESIPKIVDWVGRNASKITCKEVQQGKHPIYALHRPRDQSIFEQGEKLLGVITADRPKVAVDTEQLFALDGIFVLSPEDGVDAYYLAGLLNSSVMTRIYQVFSQEEGRVMAQVKPTVLSELPAVHPNSKDESIKDLASVIAGLSKRLHKKNVDEVTRSKMMAELDETVEQLFARAVAISEAKPSTSRREG